MTFDLKIEGGFVYDGMGAPPFAADIGIAGDRITAVGPLGDRPARATIDARGRAVSPGFIDVHSHSDSHLLIEPSAPSKIFQGVTTEVVGNCGLFAAPAAAGDDDPFGEAADGSERSFPRVARYREKLAAVGPAPNVALLIGHNTLRASAMGYADRRSDPGDRRRMVRALEQAMDEGGWGLSTGLIYSPGRYADRDEIVELARAAARRGGLYATHMRNESDRLVEAVDEALAIGAAADIRVQVSHLKASGRANWPLLDGALARIRAAIAEGRPVAADRYPYIASCTGLKILLPSDEAAGTTEEILARLRDPASRARIRGRILAAREPDYWDGVLIGATTPANAAQQGRRLAAIAAGWGLAPVDAALRLLESDGLSTGAIFFSMSEEGQWRVLAEPFVMIGSDASIRSPEGPLSADHPHPRAYGSFPLFLRAALDGRTVPPAEAVRKMTSLPARTFGFRDRGELRAGAFADVVVWDPASVRDRATYERPHQLAEGIADVVVNGVPTLSGGRPTGKRAGRFLDRGSAA